MNVFYRPIVIQKIDEETEQYTDLYSVHASVNKSKDDDEYLRAGAIQSKRKLTFEVRWFPELEDIALHTQWYRIIFEDVAYNVTSYDDYFLRHKVVKLLGESIA